MSECNNVWDEVDKRSIERSVLALDIFTKHFCRVVGDYERFDDLQFRCERCPFKDGDYCKVKQFQKEYAPDYQGFGSMVF